MRPLLILALVAVMFALPGQTRADGLKPSDFRVARGEVFEFAGPTGDGKSTLIAVVPGFVVIGQGDDQIIADREKRDLYAPGPDGNFMSLRQMVTRFTGGAAESGSAGAGSGSMDPDAEFEALFSGLPPTMKGQLREQFKQLPRDQAIKAIQVLRGQMGLPQIDPGQLPKRAPPKEVVRTGNTDRVNGLKLHEYLVAGDRVWAVNADQLDGGEKLLDGLIAFAEIHNEIAEGLPTVDSSFFRMAELDGRAPYRVITEDGETFTYKSTTTGDVKVPDF